MSGSDIGDSASLNDTLAGELSEPRREVGKVEPGARLGRYIVLGMLGRGGMGAVYSAFDPELDRKVALKLLQPGRRDPEATSRLVREGQAMAKLNHPNVIAVYDVGRIDDAVFVAMELVEGQTLRDWLERDRSWQDVVALFVQAGRGLDAAHRAGLVHRDFKPDNVMIGEDGRVRVLDFGLARPGDETAPTPTTAELAAIREASLTDMLSAKMTRTGAMLGTPAYMSPEQLAGAPTDALGDQFSFSVALYEGLYRQAPYAGDTLAARAFAVSEGKLREPPAKSGVPRMYWSLLQRGLAVDPGGRHPSMAVLVEALERDPTTTRRRVWLATGTIIGIGVLAVAAARNWPEDPVDACVARGEGALERVLASDRLDRVGDAFGATGGATAEESWLATRVELDRFATALTVERASTCEAAAEPERAAELSLRVGCLDRALRRADALLDAIATPDTETVIASPRAASQLPEPTECGNLEVLERSAAPAPSTEMASTVESLRLEIERIEARLEAGQVDGVADVATATVDEARGLGYTPLIAEAIAMRARAQHTSGDMKQAVETLEEAIYLAEASGDDGLAAETWLQDMTFRLTATGDHEKCYELARRVDAAIVRIGNPAAMRHAYLMKLAMIELARGRHDEALVLAERALEVIATEPEDEVELANVRNDYATILMRRSDYEKAAVQLELVAEAYRRRLGSRHPKVGNALTNLAQVRAAEDEIETAVAMLEQAHAIFVDAYGSEHPHVGAALNGLGLMSSATGAFADAKDYWERALGIFERQLGDEHRFTLIVLRNLGTVHIRMGQSAEALVYYRRAAASAGALHGADTPRHMVAKAPIALALLLEGDVDEAERMIEQILPIARTDDPDGELAYTLLVAGRIALVRGRVDEAAERFEEVRALAPSEADQRFAAVAWLAVARREAGKSDIEHLLAEARQIASKHRLPAPHEPELRELLGDRRSITE